MALRLAYCDRQGRIFFDEDAQPLADGGIVREIARHELIPAPAGTVPMVLPGRVPLTTNGAASRRQTLAVMLPAGYTRTLVPAFRESTGAPALPLFGYTFACAVDDELYVAAMKTDESEDWTPRSFAPGELESIVAARVERDPKNQILAQLGVCSREYGCFTAQNVFLERGEAALPVSPKCNARCVGCISEQEDDSPIVAPQMRVSYEAEADDLTRIALHHLERVDDGIVSFGQGCEGEPLLRATTIARTIERIRAQRPNGTINMNTNGSLPRSLERCIDAGLQAIRISLNSFRVATYAAYYRPIGYSLDDVLASIRLAVDRGLRVSINVLTHPGVTDAQEEVDAMETFLSSTRVHMIQTRTLNIDPHRYFETVGRPEAPLGMREAIARIERLHVSVGNFTHTH